MDRKDELEKKMLVNVIGYETNEIIAKACAETAINFTIEILEKIWPHSSDAQKVLKELKKIKNP